MVGFERGVVHSSLGTRTDCHCRGRSEPTRSRCRRCHGGRCCRESWRRRSGSSPRASKRATGHPCCTRSRGCLSLRGEGWGAEAEARIVGAPVGTGRGRTRGGWDRRLEGEMEEPKRRSEDNRQGRCVVNGEKETNSSAANFPQPLCSSWLCEHGTL